MTNTVATIIPVSTTKNTFCRASRDKSAKVYAKECETALRNQLGPGPGYYESRAAELKSLPGTEKDRYTIGQVSLSYFIIIGFSGDRVWKVGG